MSFDGEQRIVIVRTKDEDAAASRARAGLRRIGDAPLLESPRTIGLRYEFGYGRTTPVGFAQLDAIVKLPWRRVASGAKDVDIRVLQAGALEAAAGVVDDLRKKPRTLARLIARTCKGGDESAYVSLKASVTAPDPDDADTDTARLAQIFMQLRRAIHRALKQDQNVAVAILVQGY